MREKKQSKWSLCWISAVLMAACVILPALTIAQEFKAIPNEFNRSNGSYATDEFVEILLLERTLAADLNNFALGDSDAFTNAKNGIYKFQNLENIATHFEAGTLILVGGPTQIPIEDLTYNPWGGNSDWDLSISVTNTTYITRLSAGDGDHEGKDVVWVDDTTAAGYASSAVSTSGFAAHYGSGGLGTFATNANVQYVGGTFGNGKCMNLMAAPGLAGDPNNWNDAICTAGLPNGEDNTVYIISLREGTLLVDMANFEITSMEPGQGVVLSWETAAEMDNVGFKVYAAKEAPGGGYRTGESLSGLIPAKGDAFRGASYSWTDAVPYTEGESRGYFVTDVDLDGFETPHGPVWTVRPMTSFSGVDQWNQYNF